MKTSSIVIAVALLALPARAATVEPRVRLLVRERPAPSARIVDRVAPGHKLPLLGHSSDGAWTHVQTPRKGIDGWVPSGQLKGGRALRPREEANADADAVARADIAEAPPPLAVKRGVRAEAWVSASRYHDAENNQLTVAAARAELYGRPALGGAVIGVVRRGEAVQLVRRSADGNWILVDVGGGEVAWLETRNLRAGAFRAPPSGETLVAEPPRAIAREEVTPPPPAAVTKKSKAKRKRPVELASRGDLEAERAAPAPPSAPSPAPPPTGDNFLGVGARVGARVGVAILSQRFTSNGSGPLSNYEAGTNALGVQVGAGYTRAVGHYFRLGLDGSYAFAGAAGVRYRTANDTPIVLGVQSHTLDFGLGLGVHLDALGGLELRARLGGELGLDMIQASTQAPLPSDRVLGMTAGLGLAAPNLLQLGNRPFGLFLYGWALAPATRAQTSGLEDGLKSTTLGAQFGGGLTYGLYRGLGLVAAYSYGFALTHYTGQAPRNATVTSADCGTAQHLLTVGLAYNY